MLPLIVILKKIKLILIYASHVIGGFSPSPGGPGSMCGPGGSAGGEAGGGYGGK